jgi:AraC-like DNA-binding protein
MNRRKTAPPRGVLKTAAADPQRYEHARYHASPDLDPYIEHYWSVQWDLRGLPPERAGGSISQSALALDLGYSDQAHFVHDFTAVVGTSPAAYARAARRAQP